MQTNCVRKTGAVFFGSREIIRGNLKRAKSTRSIIETRSISSNGNRTEWSPIRSVIIRVITKSDDRTAGVRFVYHEYDY